MTQANPTLDDVWRLFQETTEKFQETTEKFQETERRRGTHHRHLCRSLEPGRQNGALPDPTKHPQALAHRRSHGHDPETAHPELGAVPRVHRTTPSRR
ncbi:hypothetical protein CKO36_12950 [Rhabdochromatium marinum]|nr:hypothetical protein [Rhabdochromatium marinum]